MKKVVLPLIILTSVLASCGQENTAPTPTTSNTASTMATEEDFKAAAQLLVDNGFSKNDAQEVQNMINEHLESQQIKQQSVSEYQKTIDSAKNLNNISKFILNDTVKTRLTAQWRLDNATLAYRAQAIALSSMPEFANTKNRRWYDTFIAALNWDNNGCSIPFGYLAPVQFVSQNFNEACIQHDFGYRNGAIFKQTHSLAHKMAVDTHFLNNMRIICDRNPVTAWNCRQDAIIVYNGVSNIAVEAWWLATTPRQNPGQY